MIKYTHQMKSALLEEYESLTHTIQIFETNGVVSYFADSIEHDERIFIIIIKDKSTENETVKFGNWNQVQQILYEEGVGVNCEA